MKTVLYITTYYTTYAISFFNNLSKIKNYKFVFIFPNTKNNKNKKDKINFTKINIKEKKIFNFLENIYEICYYKLFGLEKVIKKYKPNIIVLHNRHILNFLLNKNLRYLKKKNSIKLFYRTIPYLIPQNNFDILKKYKGNNHLIKLLFKLRIIQLFVFNYYKLIFRYIDHFLTYVPQGKKIISSYSVERKKISTVYNSVDTFELDKIEKKIKRKIKKKYDLVYIGSLNYWKKIELFVKAGQLFKKRNIKIIIIGSGPKQEKYEKQVKENNLDKVFIFKGQINDKKKIYKILKQSRIFVLPGPGGLAINDAMHASLPIVCSKADGTEKFLVKHRFNGLYFKENNYVDMYKKICILLNQRGLCNRMGKNSKKIINEKYNSTTINEKYAKALKK